MSETKVFKGKIKSTGLSLSQFLEVNRNSIDEYLLDQIVDDPKEVFGCAFFHLEKYFIDHQQHNPTVWEYIKLEELEGSFYCHLDSNADGSISFNTSFYNGGTCLDEMLSDAIAEERLDE